jgi:nicotinamide mononucleotide transporter
MTAMSMWELLAVVLGVAYLLLALRESLWCWYAAFASTAIFLFIFWDVNLLMESALQVYYLIMAVYGWWQWQQGEPESDGLAITWMVARKILENWLYWLVIDSVSIFLYLDRGLYLTALLFIAYLVIAVFGYRTWLRHYRATYS